MLNRNIFREYDVRGIVDRDLNPAGFELIGLAVGTFLRRSLQLSAPRITVGRDCRLTSPAYQQALMDGLRATGCQVIDVGMVPTPVLYFAHHTLDSDAGLEVTASHNPREYNGLKLRTRHSPVYGQDLQAIYTLLERQDFDRHPGSLTAADVAEAYLDHICAGVKLERPLKLVLDTGNGVAGPLATRLYRKLGCEVIELYTEPDGRFPHHIADPTVPRYMVDLCEQVRETGASIGIGLDGDGDRMGAVDETGTLWAGDRTLMLFARQVLARAPGQAIVFDVKCSQDLIDDVKAHGGTPVMWKTGYPLISAKLKESGAPLAGEMSGHTYFGDRYLGYDDGLYAGARLLEILASDVRPMSQLLPPSRMVSTPEMRLPCPDERKFEVVAAVAQSFRKTHEVLEIDGVRIRFQEGWGLVRASNTQPVLVARFEAGSSDALSHMMTQVERVLREEAGMIIDLEAERASGGGDH